MQLKKHLLSILIFLSCLLPSEAISQKQLNLDVDNDLYFDRDFYYSSGIFLTLMTPNAKNDASSLNNPN